MLKNYFKIAVRNLANQKIFSAINIIGLALGLCCAVLIALWVQDEYAFDQFHKNKDRIYHVIAGIDSEADTQFWTNTPGMLAEAIIDEVTGIETAIKVTSAQTILLFNNDQIYKERGIFADPDFLKVFDFPLTEGHSETALKELNSVILSYELANKLFVDGKAIGRTVMIEDVEKEEYIVTGVLDKIPIQSTLQFDFLIPFDKFQQYRPWNKSWGNFNDLTYVLLQENTPLENVSDQVLGLAKRHQENSTVNLYLDPFNDIYLESDFNQGSDEGDRIRYVRFFTIIGIIVLLIACINFMNLSTAIAGMRAKEVGVRKTTGATKKHLILQFLGESVLIAFIALCLGTTFADLLLPQFNQLTGKSLLISYTDPVLLLRLISLGIFIGILAGVYPAFYLSSFQPAKVLKGAAHSGKSLSGVRKLLVITQFASSIVFIIGTIFVHGQLRFIMNKDLGASKENILFHGQYGVMGNQKSYKNELLKIPGVKSVAYSDHNPLQIWNTTYSPSWKGKGDDESFPFHVVRADKDLIKVFNIRIIAGSNFTEKVDTTIASFIINEAAAKVMKMDQPIGEEITVWGDPGNIIGMVKDFHHQSLFKNIEPVIFYYNPKDTWNCFVSLDPRNISESVASIENVYKRYEQEHPFEYRFVEESFESQYESVAMAGTLANIFAIISILVACMGLFGLASYMTSQRIKEIGIRKVFGASVLQLVTTFSRDFLKLVIIAFIISIPVIWYIVDEWLNGFSFRIDLVYWPFILGGAFAVIIALITVSYHTLRASKANPVQSLRQE